MCHAGKLWQTLDREKIRQELKEEREKTQRQRENFTDVPTDVTFVPPSYMPTYANQEFNKRERNKREGKHLD